MNSSEIFSVEKIEVIAAMVCFLAPGYIFDAVQRNFSPQKSEFAELSTIRIISLSSLNYGFWLWLIYLSYTNPFFTSDPLKRVLVWTLVGIISPIILGLLWALFREQDYLDKMLDWIGLKYIHRIPTAWDYKFFNQIVPVWVLVTLKDNTQVYGYFGYGSFASSDPSERDIYIETLFVLSLTGTWEPVPRSNGIWLNGSEIKHIEFIRTDEIQEVVANGENTNVEVGNNQTDAI